MNIKKSIFILLFVSIFLSIIIVGCAEQNSSVIEQNDKSEVYQMEYLQRLQNMNAIINMDAVKESELEDSWVKFRTVLSNTDFTISLYELNSKIYAYNIITQSNLDLTAEDIVDLYQNQNEEKQAEFNQLYEWFLADNGITKYNIYYNGLIGAKYLYDREYGSLYGGKDYLFQLTAEECAQLAKWAIENPDYTYAQEDSDRARWYARFLELMGLSSETEQQGGSDESNIAT